MNISKELWRKGLDEYLRVVDTSFLDGGELDDLIFEPAVLVSAMIGEFGMDVQCVGDDRWIAYCGYGDVGEGSNHWEAVFNDFICVSEHLEGASK